MARSIAEISKSDAVSLRKEAAEMMRKNPSLVYTVNGMEWTAGQVRSKGRKQDLVKHISMWEGQLEKNEITPQPQAKVETKIKTPETKVQTTTPQTKIETPKPEIDPENDYTQSEQEKLAVAKRLYFSSEKKDEWTGLREYHENLCKSKKLFSSENFAKFAQLVAKARIIIEAYANDKSPNDKASPGGMQAIRVEIMKYLKELCEVDKDKFDPVNDRTLMDTFNEYDDAVRGAFKDISRIKYQLYKEKNDAGERDVRRIKVSPFIDWAKDMVCNLPGSIARWKEVSIAIMLLTGRRQSEVLATGLFEYVDDYHVMFEGQLKRHIDEPVPPTEIPVIKGVAKEIVAAIQWLETHGKRTLPEERTYEGLQKAAKISHNRCSRYISETMSKLEDSDLVTITNGKTWKDNKGNNVFKGHITRQIYAQICSQIFVPDDQKKQSFIADILLESRDAAPSYDRDIEIEDIEAIKQI